MIACGLPNAPDVEWVVSLQTGVEMTVIMKTPAFVEGDILITPLVA